MAYDINDLMKNYGDYLFSIENPSDVPLPKVVGVSSPGLHHVLGLPGVPLNTIIEIFGPADSGKGSSANLIISYCQRALQKPALFINVEGDFNYQYAEQCGVLTEGEWLKVAQSDQKKLTMSRNGKSKKGADLDGYLFGDTALEMLVSAVRSKAFSCVVLDSIGSLIPRSVFEGEVTDAFMGVEAKVIGRAIKKLQVVKAHSDTAIVLINQIRAKMGVKFGSNEGTPGGFGLEHGGRLRLRVGRGEKIEVGGKVLGHFISITSHKNHFTGQKYRNAKLPLIYGKGIYPPYEVLTLCKKFGIIKQSSGNYILKPPKGKEINLGKGILKACQTIEAKYMDKLVPLLTSKLENHESDEIIVVE